MSSISFEQAIGQLQAMFPAVSQDVIVAVLEANGGQMQHTVSQLLELDPGEAGTAAAPTDAAQPVAPPPSTTPTAPSSSRSLSEHAPRARGRSRSTASATGPGKRRWRNPLPRDFLCVPGAGRPHHTSTPDDQLSQDALLAQMLENELFLEELRNHPDFAEYLDAEQAFFHGHEYAASLEAGARMEARQRRTAAGRRSGHRTGQRRDRQSESAGVSLGDKIAAMGGEMRRKFNAFAMRFSKRGHDESSAATARPSRGHGEYRGLLEGSDSSDDEGEGDAAHRRRRGRSDEDRGMELAPAPSSGHNKRD